MTAAAVAAASQPRYDYYQTDTAVNLAIFVKGLKDDDVDVTFGQHSISVSLRPPASPPQSLELQLFDDIDAANSSFKILSSKVDLLLRKSNPGRRWEMLESKAGGSVPSYEAATSSATSTSSHPAPSGTSSTTRPRSKWETLNLDLGDDPSSTDGAKKPSGEDGNGDGGGGGIDAFFQKLYADADDDTRRAMMKSYTESGGTSLSTNWTEVGKKKMETRPPEGMEARKW